jgi:cation diffusion facilitator CzcD-associated flavoprotein CzcO
VFEPNPDWSHFYTTGPEIEYIQRTARKWNLYDNIQPNSKVVEAAWDEPAGKWKVKISQDGIIKEDEAEIFVSALGPLK